MIRAGRSESGQPTSEAPATPDNGAAEPATTEAGTKEADTEKAGAEPTTDTEPGTSIEPGTSTSTNTEPTPDRTAEAELAESREPETEAAAPGTPATTGGGGGWFRRATGQTWVRHLVLLLAYQGAGIAATWPRATWLADGRLPATSDVSGFVWNLWWAAHQLQHGGNPFFTTYMAAPVGTHLAFSTLMPLAGWLMSPITVMYGPSASFTLLTIITPGLLCYAMYRAARLWLNEPGSIVAGAFFGLSSMLMWQNWYHVNIAIGTILLPVTIETAIRFRRNPRLASAIMLGIALGASILINQETTVVAVFLTAIILIPWLVRALVKDRSLLRKAITPLAIGAGIGIVVASPELISMLQQILAGGAKPPIGQFVSNYAQFGASLPTLFAPSPRLANFGLGHLASSYSYYNAEQVLEGLPTFGIVLTVVAVLGVVIGWRKRSTWAFLALWLIPAALALGTSLTIGKKCVISQGIYHRPGKVYGLHCTQYLPLMGYMHYTKVIFKGGPPNGTWEHVVVSNLMPYTWLVRIPGLSGLREADRFALVGLLGAAMLAGLTVQWLCQRKVTMPLIAIVVGLGALEAGWSGAPVVSPGYHGTMPTTMPNLDKFLNADRSRSIVVDVPYGLRGGVGITGAEISPRAMLIATNDEHPRAISYTAWVSKASIVGVARHAFYRYLYEAERSHNPNKHQVALARADLRTLDVGWVVMWRNMWTLYHPVERWAHVDKYLVESGFRHTKGICLVKQKPGATCPSTESIWLYQYEPGHPGKVGG